MERFNRFNLGLRSVLVAVAVVISSVAYGQSKERTARDFDLGQASEVLVNIMRELESGFVDEISAGELLDAAAAGMIVATDPYSEYLSESDMDGFEIMTTGRYGGVGSLIRKRGDYVIFAQPYKGSPSDVAGVKIGDKILAIDGVDMKGAATEDISSRLKGEPPTQFIRQQTVGIRFFIHKIYTHITCYGRHERQK